MKERKSVRGVVHVHTTYSRDGLLSPERIASMCRERGVNFAAISDHVEDMDEQSMEQLVRECGRYSSDSFVMVPGLEHRTSYGIHILALGQRRLVARGSLTDFLKSLADEGCVLIGAHNYSCRNLLGDALLGLHAMEVWNLTRDTRYFPVTAALRAYRCCLKRNAGLMAIGGLDMHNGREWGCELRLTNCGGITADDVLSSVRRGDFSSRGKFVSFSSRPGLGAFAALAAKTGDTLVHIREIRDFALAAFDDTDYVKRNT